MSTWSTRQGISDRPLPPRAVDGRPGPARAAGAHRAPLHLRRHAERDLRDPPGRAALPPCASRRRRRPPAGTRASCREWRIIEALTGPTCPTPRPSPCAPTLGARPGVLPDGLRRRMVTHGLATDGRRRSTPTRAAEEGARLPDWRRASRCCRRWTGGQGACTTWAGPTASMNARSTGGPPSSSGSRAASCPASTWRRLAPGSSAARLHPGHHARRLPVRQRHVPPRCAGPAGRDRRLGDGHGG